MGRGKVDTVFARVYLVARGDIDTDGDGISDARELFLHGSDPTQAQTTVISAPTVIEPTNSLYEGHS